MLVNGMFRIAFHVSFLLCQTEIEQVALLLCSLLLFLLLVLLTLNLMTNQKKMPRQQHQ
jgi:uncharacterized membrane protein